MPTVETPFFTDVHSFEELHVAMKANETAAEATDRGGAGGFHRNAFSAMVTTLCFFEEPLPLPANSDNGGGKAVVRATEGTPAKERRPKKGPGGTGGKACQPSEEGRNDSVRVSLVARVKGQGAADERPRSSASQTITLASWTFAPAVEEESQNHKRRRDEDGDVASAADEAASVLGSSTGERKPFIHAVSLTTPLLFRSDTDSVESLAVVAHTVPCAATAEVEGLSAEVKKLRRYTGLRRFTVRLCGVQRTELTKDQVVLLSS